MTLTQALQQWFIENQRLLPFRQDKDPYRVWISEIMAQQTQIDTMIPYYERWMTQWPTLQALAQADENELLKAWEGLGYYTRVRNIHKAALLLKDQEYQFPTELTEIRALPGIGAYTAAAIASICFETKAVAIDGNVYRVVSRLFQMEDELGSKALQNQVTEKMEAWMSSATPSIFTQAMMELGALICTPKNPDCIHCPLKDRCESFKSNSMTSYPNKKASKAKPIHHKLILIYLNDKHKIALTLTASDQLMKGYWRFPETDTIPDQALLLGEHHHVFTHLIWNLEFYLIHTNEAPQASWFTLKEIDALPLITAHRVFFEKIKSKIDAFES